MTDQRKYMQSLASAAIYRGAVSRSFGQGIAQVEDCPYHRKSSIGDIRDVMSIGKLVRKNDGPEEVGQILATMIKYGNERALNGMLANLRRYDLIQDFSQILLSKKLLTYVSLVYGAYYE
jgi:hypothetical protein